MEGTGDDCRGARAGDGKKRRLELSRRSFLKGAAGAGIVSANLGLFADLAAAGVNAITTENALAGAPPSEWESWNSDQIQGFTTQMSYLPGETVRFKVKTVSSSYRIRVYRMGWYGGNGARRLADVTPSAILPQTQPAPVTNGATGLVDCGNWALSGSWTIPTDAVSGVYYALFDRLDVANQNNYAIFVVRRPGPSDVMVQTSDTTWQAYNRYGGNSLYFGAPVGRAYKVSYNRPANPDVNENTFFGSEYPLVRFLERNGYDVSYCSGLDVHQSATGLNNCKVFVSSGHDEYWSGPQRANVEAARDGGNHLIFMSGNEVFWKIRFEPSIDGTNTPDRTLVCYKETLDGAKTDPTSTWTGTWRDPRFSPPSDGGKPENGLIGLLFRCINPTNASDFAIKVPAQYAPLRFWRNTAVAALGTGQTATLAPNSLGYEWDQDVENAVRPAGLIHLSSTTATAQQVLQDYGGAYTTASVTHNLTMYRASSGALVFATGTCQWSYGLDSYHTSDEGSVTNTNMQQATVNVLADMGVQPASLQSGLSTASKSTDALPPATTITAPAANASVAVGSQLTVTGTAVDAGGGHVAAVEVSVDGGTTWHPAVGTSSWSYVFMPTALGALTIKSRAVDDSLNLESPGAGVTVQVGQRPLPCPIWPNTVTPTTPSSGDASAIEVGVRFRAVMDGFVTGLRFYKGAGNTGTHVGHLWTSSGQLLATQTFTSETAGGWQQVSITPVAVTAGTTYVASCYMPNGNYGVDSNYFAAAWDLWPLRALADNEDGPNGVFRYGSSGFPSTTFGAANYWVDVVFDADDNQAPTVVDVSPGANLQSVSPATTLAATFSEGMDASSIVFDVRDPAATAVTGTTTYDVATRRATFTPSAALAGLTKYTIKVGAKDSSGAAMAAPFTWSVTTIGAPGATPTSLWDTSATPASVQTNDTNAVELGVKFTSTSDGSITALRFYKVAGSPGPHIGHLWTGGGQLLATVTFTETAAGWQQANLSTPVTVQKHSVYVASYHSPAGVYGVSGSYFGSSSDREPLHAPASGAVAGGNGVFRYGASAFPTDTFAACNYWADVVFAAAADSGAPTVVSTDPAVNLISVSTGAAVRASFGEQINPSSVVFTLRNASQQSVPGAVAYDAASATATFTPSAALANGTTYTASVLASDTAGNAMASATTWSFTTVVTGGNTPATLWDTSATPAVASANDSSGAELGLRFTADRGGAITGVRFYKGTGNTGTHVGHLWTGTGTLLGTATFSDESASGWQQANFSSPVAVTAGSAYVVSYYAPNGHYSVTGGAFNATSTDNAPLHAPASTSSAGNGLYLYGAGGFPTDTYIASNYWVEPIFIDNVAPTVVSQTPDAGVNDVSTGASVSAKFGEPVQPQTVVFQLKDGSGANVAGSVSYDAPSFTTTFAPSAALSSGATYTASVSGARDLEGNTMATPAMWSFTTVGSTVVSLWPDGTTPAVTSANDSGAVELGVKVMTTAPGVVRGVRFYKGSGNTGVHKGNLWASDGTLLATVTFSGESATGWQQANLASPVRIDPNTTYVVSYHTPTGRYAVDGGYFATERANGPLHAPADGAAGGNGVYLYGGGGFPTGSYSASNYWVDLVFLPD
jgi:hypothetical protein